MPTSADTTVHPWGSSGPEVLFADDVSASDRDEISTLLAGWEPDLFEGKAEVTVLIGGANNRNFVVEASGGKYALRVANPQNERFAVDRASAIKAQRAAAAGGLAPYVFATRLPDGHILSEFVEGGTLLDTEQLTDPDVLRLGGAALKRLHGLPASIRSYSPFDDIRLWAKLARADGTELPDDLPELLRAADLIEQLLVDADLPAVFCHNDTVPQNIIRFGSELRLVDWDYAGLGWACFELASFCATAELDPDQMETFLTAYDPHIASDQRSRVELLGLVAAIRETCWALMAAPILKGKTTPDEEEFYEKYWKKYLNIARDRFGSAQFGQLLEEARSDRVGSW